MTEEEKKTIKQIINFLVEKRYAQLEHGDAIGRITKEGIQQRISEYGCNLANLPDEAFELAQEYRINDFRTDVFLPLWTEEEGRSDLTVSFSIFKELGRSAIVLNDLEVL